MHFFYLAPSVLFIVYAVLAHGAVWGAAERLCKIKARRYAPSRLPDAFDTELDNTYDIDFLNLSDEGTALVLVDVWNDSGDLLEYEKMRIRPLLALARRRGWYIIHAPSEMPEWGGISVLPGEAIVRGVDGRPGSASLCSPLLTESSRNFNHVLVAGFDADRCVLDKPCGILRLTQDLLPYDVEVILVRDSTLAATGSWFGNLYYSTEASVNLIEAGRWLPRDRQFVRSITLLDCVMGCNIPKNDPIAVNASTPLGILTPSAGGNAPVHADLPSWIGLSNDLREKKRIRF